MTDNNDPIAAALAAEERDLLRRIAQEPAYFEEVASLFGGRSGWVNQVMMASQLVLFVAGAWMAFNFFAATEALQALKWGLPAATLVLMSLMIKLAMMPSLQTNRVLRELKRLELLAAQQRS
jgi:hypothetical protein